MNYASHCTARTRLCALVLWLVLPCSGISNEQVQWWSLQPVVRPPVPGKLQTNPAHPIDAFIHHKLKEAGFDPSPEAEPRTLVRRLYFDLIGLPPSPEETDRFVSDKNPHAYELLVEKLLGSPQYGERWARHWLDIVRFAETHGFEMNQPRPNAWPYRDYVIRSLNEDKPYDQFVLEQIAGDVFGRPEATGFLVGGPWDQVKSPDPVLTANQRADELHDIVSTTGSTFLGLTVGCARCHDHKFDPIPQTDYYSIRAVFEGVQHGEQKLDDGDQAEREKKMAELAARLARIETALDFLEPVAQSGAGLTQERPPVHPLRNVERLRGEAAERLRFTISKTTDAEPCIDELEVYTADGRNAALASAGTVARASSIYPNSEIHRLEHINDGRHGNGRSWISNEPGKGWVELRFPREIVIQRIVWGRDREGRYADRLPTDYRIEVASGDGEWRIIASSLDRLPYGLEDKTAESAVESAHAADSGKARTLRKERSAVLERIQLLEQVPMVYSGSFKADPDATYRLHRGDPLLSREEIPPRALSAIELSFPIGASETKDLTDDQQRRLAFAKWIVDRKNPLAARVMANRIWQYHFGEGLVSTPSDFGRNGALPTHPELLDWLAAEFLDSGWSIKHLHRLIVTSGTYRQSSLARPECAKVDADGRLLWRFPPRRLEAEAIRDAILAASGKLDLGMGGPGFSFFEPNDNYVRVYTPRAEWGPEAFRRMIYGTIVRQRPDGVFGVFDCPDAGQIAPKRTSSTTPLQALNLLNSSFILQQSEFFANRLLREAGGDSTEQVQLGFRLAFQRQASPEEVKPALEMIEAHGLALFCRALLNANEFVYLF